MHIPAHNYMERHNPKVGKPEGPSKYAAHLTKQVGAMWKALPDADRQVPRCLARVYGVCKSGLACARVRVESLRGACVRTCHVRSVPAITM